MLSVKIHDEYCISSARLLKWLLRRTLSIFACPLTPDQLLEFL